MKLAESILEKIKPIDESAYSNERITVNLPDGNDVMVHYSIEIYKNQSCGTGSIRVNDIEKESTIKDMLKQDGEVFMKAASNKLKNLQNI